MLIESEKLMVSVDNYDNLLEDVFNGKYLFSGKYDVIWIYLGVYLRFITGF